MTVPEVVKDGTDTSAENRKYRIELKNITIINKDKQEIVKKVERYLQVATIKAISSQSEVLKTEKSVSTEAQEVLSVYVNVLDASSIPIKHSEKG